MRHQTRIKLGFDDEVRIRRRSQQKIPEVVRPILPEIAIFQFDLQTGWREAPSRLIFASPRPPGLHGAIKVIAKEHAGLGKAL